MMVMAVMMARAVLSRCSDPLTLLWFLVLARDRASRKQSKEGGRSRERWQAGPEKIADTHIVVVILDVVVVVSRL